MIGIRSLALAALALVIASAGYAQQKPHTTSSDAGLVTIFDNFAHKYPKALYLDLTGAEIRGGGGGALQAWWAAPFTPDADHIVTRIEVPVSLYSGTDGLVLSLNADAGGVPGSALMSWKLKHITQQGTCCAVKTGNDRQGISIQAGQQYWVVLSTDRKEGSTWANWLSTPVDQVDSGNIASYSSIYGWLPGMITPQLAFAVRGSK